MDATSLRFDLCSPGLNIICVIADRAAVGPNILYKIPKVSADEMLYVSSFTSFYFLKIILPVIAAQVLICNVMGRRPITKRAKPAYGFVFPQKRMNWRCPLAGP